MIYREENKAENKQYCYTSNSSKTVYLIDNVDSQHKSDYSLTESMILVKGKCDLKPTYLEDKIPACLK